MTSWLKRIFGKKRAKELEDPVVPEFVRRQSGPIVGYEPEGFIMYPCEHCGEERKVDLAHEYSFICLKCGGHTVMSHGRIRAIKGGA